MEVLRGSARWFGRNRGAIGDWGAVDAGCITFRRLRLACEFCMIALMLCGIFCSVVSIAEVLG